MMPFSPNQKKIYLRLIGFLTRKKLPADVKISFSMIYDFMISRKIEAGSAVTNFKGMDRAVKHYHAGDMKDISCAQVEDSTIYIKSTCQASMKKQKYEVYICLTKREDHGTHTIDSAYCQCPIGLAQACSHVGALLFALSNMRTCSSESSSKEPLSCTSVLCEWKVPRTTAKPQPTAVLTQRKPPASTADPLNEESTPTPQTTFDPRHSSDRAPNLQRTLNHLQRLKEIFPKTGMTHLWNIQDSVPSASHEEEIETDPLFMKMEQMLYTKGNLPPPSIDIELAMYVERYTRKQRDCDMWRKLHHGRITSSLFGDVLSAGQNPSSLVKQIGEGSNLEKYTNVPEAVQWGFDHEDMARAENAKTVTA